MKLGSGLTQKKRRGGREEGRLSSIRGTENFKMMRFGTSVALTLVFSLVLLNEVSLSLGQACGNGTYADFPNPCQPICGRPVPPDTMCIQVVTRLCKCFEGYVRINDDRCVLPEDCK
ncbi:uncharacterized protein WCC33_011574 [Rhinophrynus dorsalis]